MFDLNRYLDDLILNCRSLFGERLLYIGLQGSYLRGEAHENSDIDIMVILDGFSVRDMDTYRGILKKIGFYEKSCGFICGKEEMKRWNPDFDQAFSSLFAWCQRAFIRIGNLGKASDEP